MSSVVMFVTAILIFAVLPITVTLLSFGVTKKSALTINLPASAIRQQIEAKRAVDLTVVVPSDVANDSNPNCAVDIKAAKENRQDVTLRVQDADTQEVSYTWTFKGEDLAKSSVPAADVNIAMSVKLTTEVPEVNSVTPDKKGVVLAFDHSGALPATANVQISVQEKGFKPGDTLYFYYYNPTTKQVEPMGKQYTVDAFGFVTVQIDHCSDYVLLPYAHRSIALDTRAYTMKPGDSYITGVTLTNAPVTVIKAYSSTKGIANVTVLANGDIKATGEKPGLTYVMIDVYDSKNKRLTHASVQLTVQNGVKPNGNSARQYGVF